MAPYTGSKLLANDLDSSLANLVGSESLFLTALLVCLCGFLYLLGHRSLTFKLHLCYSTEQRVSSHMVLYAGPSLGWNVVTIIGAHGWGGVHWLSQPTGWGQPKKTLRTVDGPLLCIVTKAYHLHVFLSLGNLNIQKSLKHSNKRCEKFKWVLASRVLCTRRGPHLTDSKTEPSSPSLPPAPEQKQIAV